MLFRKIQSVIEKHLRSENRKILVIEGARQVGKTFIIRKVCRALFKNIIEINFADDKRGDHFFEKISSVQDFYFQLGIFAGDKMGSRDDTVVFFDEIQEYPQFLTFLKFLNDDRRFTYIASGSLLGVTLSQTTSIPIGSIRLLQMYPLDFEEFMLANGIASEVIVRLREQFQNRETIPLAVHNKIMDLFRKYLIVGGLPEAVNTFLETLNIFKVRAVQAEIRHFYALDASRYDAANKLKIRRIYEMIPSSLENKKKRIVVKEVEEKAGKRYADYQDAFDYLVSAGIALEVKAISALAFPLLESTHKNLLKLYLNDVGLLTSLLYQHNINALLNDVPSINLGSVYECVVACELKAHNHPLFYYDNKKKGEVDFLIDDYDTLSIVPIEIKSGKDYTIHSALNRFFKDAEPTIQRGYLFSNTPNITTKNNIIYAPIYNVMFL